MRKFFRLYGTTRLWVFMILSLFAGAITQLAVADGMPQIPSAATVEALRLSYYEYEPSLPLNAATTPLAEKNAQLSALRTRYKLVYTSIHDQRVTAIFSKPVRFAKPYPAVVLLAGSGGHKDSDYVRLAADMMATLGYATISIDAQYHGERSRKDRDGDFHFINNDTNRDAWVQTVVDLRRAVDYLRSRQDIDGAKIGYLGFSQGGMVGGTFIGVEPRICCACLAIPGGGFLDWAKQLGMAKPGEENKLAVNAAITDPIYFIGRFSGRPLLMLSAGNDELIPKSATDALFGAAGEPKEIKWFNSGHVLPPNALIVDARNFFIKHLGVRKELTK